MLWGERRGYAPSALVEFADGESSMPKPNDLSRSLAALEQDATLIVEIEMCQSKWLVAALVAGPERRPVKNSISTPMRC